MIQQPGNQQTIETQLKRLKNTKQGACITLQNNASAHHYYSEPGEVCEELKVKLGVCNFQWFKAVSFDFMS